MHPESIIVDEDTVERGAGLMITPHYPGHPLDFIPGLHISNDSSSTSSCPHTSSTHSLPGTEVDARAHYLSLIDATCYSIALAESLNPRGRGVEDANWVEKTFDISPFMTQTSIAKPPVRRPAQQVLSKSTSHTMCRLRRRKKNVTRTLPRKM